jgi:lysosomal alpha-glucosidase
MASRFYEEIQFDGGWIDMNEPSNFVDGSVDGCPKSDYDEPPYTPKVYGIKLRSRTICASASQHLSVHYNLHNMYGHFEAIATNNALKQINSKKRPFVLTRSSFPGTGQFSAHWSGDIDSSYNHLYYSIPNMLNFNVGFVLFLHCLLNNFRLLSLLFEL